MISLGVSLAKLLEQIESLYKKEEEGSLEGPKES